MQNRTFLTANLFLKSKTQPPFHTRTGKIHGAIRLSVLTSQRPTTRETQTQLASPSSQKAAAAGHRGGGLGSGRAGLGRRTRGLGDSRRTRAAGTGPGGQEGEPGGEGRRQGPAKTNIPQVLSHVQIPREKSKVCLVVFGCCPRSPPPDPQPFPEELRPRHPTRSRASRPSRRPRTSPAGPAPEARAGGGERSRSQRCSAAPSTHGHSSTSQFRIGRPRRLHHAPPPRAGLSGVPADREGNLEVPRPTAERPVRGRREGILALPGPASRLPLDRRQRRLSRPRPHPLRSAFPPTPPTFFSHSPLPLLLPSPPAPAGLLGAEVVFGSLAGGARGEAGDSETTFPIVLGTRCRRGGGRGPAPGMRIPTGVLSPPSGGS